MQIAHLVLGHAVAVPVLYAVFALVLTAVFRLDDSEKGRIGDPLDLELVRRWNARTPLSPRA